MSRYAVDIRFDKTLELSDAMLARAKVAVAKAALDIESNAKLIVPVDTGALKNSIQSYPESELSSIVSAGDETTAPGGVTPTAEYGVYVEYGTRTSRPQPFMRPSAELVRPSFIAAMEQIAKL